MRKKYHWGRGTWLNRFYFVSEQWNEGQSFLWIIQPQNGMEWPIGYRTKFERLPLFSVRRSWTLSQLWRAAFIERMYDKTQKIERSKLHSATWKVNEMQFYKHFKVFPWSFSQTVSAVQNDTRVQESPRELNCNDNQYRSPDGVCCSSCPPGTGTVSICAVGNDTQCERCTLGVTFAKIAKKNNLQQSMRICEDCTICPARLGQISLKSLPLSFPYFAKCLSYKCQQ